MDRERNHALDGLRALAALLVLAFHCGIPGTRGGFIGVDVFFVLSGFLITGLLRAELRATGNIQITRFYWRRALRLWPPLFVMLMVYLVLIPIFWEGENVVRNTVVAGFYLSDYSLALGYWLDALSHTWSLAVEEHFYLLWPIVIVATAKITDRKLAALLLSGFFVATTWRFIDVIRFGDWSWTFYRFDTRLSGLLLGGALATLPWRPNSPVWFETIGLAGLVFMAQIPAAWSPSALLWPNLAVDLMVGAVVLSLSLDGRTWLAQCLSWRPIAYLGLSSYSIYLWHFPIWWYVREYFAPAPTFAIVTVTSIVVATLSYEFMEKTAAGPPGRQERQLARH